MWPPNFGIDKIKKYASAAVYEAKFAIGSTVPTNFDSLVDSKISKDLVKTYNSLISSHPITP